MKKATLADLEGLAISDELITALESFYDDVVKELTDKCGDVMELRTERYEEDTNSLKALGGLFMMASKGDLPRKFNPISIEVSDEDMDARFLSVKEGHFRFIFRWDGSTWNFENASKLSGKS